MDNGEKTIGLEDQNKIIYFLNDYKTALEMKDARKFLDKFGQEEIDEIEEIIIMLERN